MFRFFSIRFLYLYHQTVWHNIQMNLIKIHLVSYFSFFENSEIGLDLDKAEGSRELLSYHFVVSYFRREIAQKRVNSSHMCFALFVLI